MFFGDETGDELSESTDLASENEDSLLPRSDSQCLAVESDELTSVTSSSRCNVPLFAKLVRKPSCVNQSSTSDLDFESRDEKATDSIMKVVNEVSTFSSTTSLEKLFDSVSRDELEMIIRKS